MELKNCDTLTMLNKNSKLARNDISILMYKADTDNDYLVQSFVEQRLAIIHGKNFFISSQRKIETITYCLSHNAEDDLWDLYSNSFDIFMEKVDNDFDQIASFNIIFIAFISIGRRMLRKAKDYCE